MTPLNWLDTAYAGKIRLWRVFWLAYLLPHFPLAIGLQWYGHVAARPQWLTLSLCVVLFGYYWWVIVSLWRCAANTSKPIYTILARLVAGLVAVTTLAAAIDLLKAL